MKWLVEMGVKPLPTGRISTAFAEAEACGTPAVALVLTADLHDAMRDYLRKLYGPGDDDAWEAPIKWMGKPVLRLECGGWKARVVTHWTEVSDG